MADSCLPTVSNRITSVEFVGNRTCCGWTVSWCFKGPVSCFSTGELAERVGGGGPLETILLKGGRWGHTRNSRLNKSRLASACENKKALSVPVYSNTMRRDSVLFRLYASVSVCSVFLHWNGTYHRLYFTNTAFCLLILEEINTLFHLKSCSFPGDTPLIQQLHMKATKRPASRNTHSHLWLAACGLPCDAWFKVWISHF